MLGNVCVEKVKVFSISRPAERVKSVPRHLFFHRQVIFIQARESDPEAGENALAFWLIHIPRGRSISPRLGDMLLPVVNILLAISTNSRQNREPVNRLERMSQLSVRERETNFLAS